MELIANMEFLNFLIDEKMVSASEGALALQKFNQQKREAI